MEKWLGSLTEMKNDRKKLKKTIAFTQWTNFFEQNFKNIFFYCSDDFFEHFLKKKKVFYWMNNFLEQTVFLNKQFLLNERLYVLNDCKVRNELWWKWMILLRTTEINCYELLYKKKKLNRPYTNDDRYLWKAWYNPKKIYGQKLKL